MADLPDYYTQAQISEAEAASFKGGLDANKSPTPVSRDIYIATDTQILYVCIADGVWTGFDAATLTKGILTLYANMLGGGFQIKNIADPTAAQDAATRAYVLAQDVIEATARDAAILVETNARIAADALRLLLTGGTMSGNIAMGTNKITGLGDPTLAQDAATRAYVLAQDALEVIARNAAILVETNARITDVDAEETARGIAITAEANARIAADALRLLLAGGTMSGDIAMGNNIVSGMKAPTDDGDAARKKYVDDIGVAFLLLAGGTMSGNIAMAGHKVTGLGAPAAQDDALRYNRAEIRNAEIAAAAAIAYSKLNLGLSIVNADIAAAAAIAYSKLNLTGAIKAADIEAAAGIPLTKLEDAVCSETEADGKISDHAGLPSAHHTPTKEFFSEADDLSDVIKTSVNDIGISATSWRTILSVASGGCRFLGGILLPGASGVTARVTVDGGAEQTIAGVKMHGLTQYPALIPPIKCDTSLLIRAYNSHPSDQDYSFKAWRRAL